MSLAWEFSKMCQLLGDANSMTKCIVGTVRPPVSVCSIVSIRMLLRPLAPTMYYMLHQTVGVAAHGFEHRTSNREVLGSNPGRERFATLAISFTTFCQCFSEETLKAVGPFYLVSMPCGVKHPAQGVNV